MTLPVRRRIIEQLTALNVYAPFSVESVERFTQLRTIGAVGSGDGQFITGRGIMVIPDGTELWVADAGNDRIGRFLVDDGSWVDSFGSTGTGDGEFDAPLDLANDGTYLYVADSGNDRIQQFDLATQTYQAQWSTGVGSLPSGVWYNATQGAVYVACHDAEDVKIYSTSGTLLYTLDLNYNPIDVAVSPLGEYIYVTDGNVACRRYDVNDSYRYAGNLGLYIYTIGDKYVYVDGSGRVYVADSGTMRMYKMSFDGTEVGRYLSGGIGRLQVTTFGGLCRYKRNVFVMDKGGNRILHLVSDNAGSGIVFQVADNGDVSFVGKLFHSDHI